MALHGYADYSAERAPFSASVAEAPCPGVPISVGPDLSDSCTLGPPHLTTARSEQLAQSGTVAVVVLLIQGRFLKIRRHRLWRFREEFASSLPQRVRELLTLRRTGTIRTPQNVHREASPSNGRRLYRCSSHLRGVNCTSFGKTAHAVGTCTLPRRPPHWEPKAAATCGARGGAARWVA